MTGKNLPWIIDTGAVNHMAGMLEALRDFKEIAPCPIGERRDRLYYFRGTPRINVMKIDCMAPLKLWHKRLGHPYLQVTKLVPGIKFKESKNRFSKNCEV